MGVIPATAGRVAKRHRGSMPDQLCTICRLLGVRHIPHDRAFSHKPAAFSAPEQNQS